MGRRVTVNFTTDEWDVLDSVLGFMSHQLRHDSDDVIRLMKLEDAHRSLRTAWDSARG